MKFVEREFIFDLTVAGENDVDTAVYLDLMQVHALVNRVGTRQGKLVGIESIEVGVQPGGAATVAVWRLGHQWSVVNACGCDNRMTLLRKPVWSQLSLAIAISRCI